VTAHGSLESAAAAEREKALGYIGKPFPSADLIAVLRRALEWRAGRNSGKSEQRSVRLPTADAGQLRRVFENLFNNSIQAAPGGGLVSLAAVKLDGKAQIDMTDNGP